MTVIGVTFDSGSSIYLANIVNTVTPYLTYLNEKFMEGFLTKDRWVSLCLPLLEQLLDPSVNPPFAVTGTPAAFLTDDQMAAFTTFIEQEAQTEAQQAILQPQVITIAGTTLVSTVINNITVMGQSDFIQCVIEADTAMNAALGQHLDISESFRTREQQEGFYAKYLAGIGNYAAEPGHSNHEKGLAIDVNNGKQAEPYLNAAGLQSNASRGASGVGESWHFSYTGL